MTDISRRKFLKGAAVAAVAVPVASQVTSVWVDEADEVLGDATPATYGKVVARQDMDHSHDALRYFELTSGKRYQKTKLEIASGKAISWGPEYG